MSSGRLAVLLLVAADMPPRETDEPKTVLLAESFPPGPLPNQVGLARRCATSMPSGRTMMTEVCVMEAGSKRFQSTNSRAAKTAAPRGHCQ
jgi:hypothetical protein